MMTNTMGGRGRSEGQQDLVEIYALGLRLGISRFRNPAIKYFLTVYLGLLINKSIEWAASRFGRSTSFQRSE